MSDAMPKWEELDVIEKAIGAAVRRARRLRLQSPARGRELATVLLQEVGPIAAFDYGTKPVTFYNGDERDLVIERLTCRVYNYLPEATPADQYKPMVRQGGSWTSVSVTAGAGGGFMVAAGQAGIFDFVWNYRRDRTEARYARAPVSSFALGDPLDKRFLDFKRPLRLKTGEGVVFEVTPTVFRNMTATTDQFIVSFLGIGYRRERAIERGT